MWHWETEDLWTPVRKLNGKNCRYKRFSCMHSSNFQVLSPDNGIRNEQIRGEIAKNRFPQRCTGGLKIRSYWKKDIKPSLKPKETALQALSTDIRGRRSKKGHSQYFRAFLKQCPRWNKSWRLLMRYCIKRRSWVCLGSPATNDTTITSPINIEDVKQKELNSSCTNNGNRMRRVRHVC